MDTEMIRIILDKIDNKYVIDVMDTRQGSHLIVVKTDEFQKALSEVCYAVDTWRAAENN